MKKIFITGGTGTVGKSFISKYYEKYNFISYARNEKEQVSLKRLFPNIEIIIGGIENLSLLSSEILKTEPDIIIHAAALKHVDTAEKQPSQAILTNIIGSYNVIQSAINANVKVIIGISTDKACNPDNIYGQSKFLMEKMFLEANNSNNKFICCRFGNVAWSNGSVIPFWLSRKSQKLSLPLTDKRMTRLMFSQNDAAELIHKSLLDSKKKSGFILSKKMKKVNMFKMAKLISSKIEVFGLRPGEILHEDLISERELPYTEVDGDYIYIYNKKNNNLKNRLKNKLSSDNAVEMNSKEMNEIISNVHNKASEKLLDIKKY